MSTSPWVKFYASDWIGGTSGLTAAERGVYITIVALIYENDGPVKMDYARLARQCGITKASFRKVLSALLDERKLVETEDGLINERCEKELSERANRAQKATIAASQKWDALKQKSVENQCRNSANASAKQCLGDAYTRSQKPEPDTDKEKSTKKESSAPRKRVAANVSDLDAFKATLAEHADGERIAAYVQHRKTKRGACTAHAAKLFLRDAEAAGLSVPDAIDTAISRNWITVKAEWLANEAKRNSGQRSSEDERLAAWGIRDLGGNTRKRRDSAPGPEWDTKVDLSEVQPSAKADEQAAEVPVCDDIDDWLRVDVPPLRVVGGREQ